MRLGFDKRSAFLCRKNQSIATLSTGIFAIFAVVLSQLWLDLRQRRSHKHEVSVKKEELKLLKKEELVEVVNFQVKDITRIEDVFDSWGDDFFKNYFPSEMSQVLRDMDNRLNKMHVLVQLYLPDYIVYIDKTNNESQGFHELCQDFFMCAKFGYEDFHALDMLEITEVCNGYSVAYMQLTSHLINPKLVKRYPVKKVTEESS